MGRKAVVLIFIGVLLAVMAMTSAWRLAARERASKAYNHDNLIRLHIIANSNDPGDQELKYRVRDAIITAFSPELQRLRSRADAEALLAADQGKIARLAERVIADNGRRYPARVEIGDFDFPTRTYGTWSCPLATTGRYGSSSARGPEPTGGASSIHPSVSLTSPAPASRPAMP